MELLDRLSVKEDKLAPLEDRMAQSHAEAFKEYGDPFDAAMLAPATQYRLFEDALKSLGIYEAVETLLSSSGRNRYGDYIQIKMRFGTLVVHQFHQSGLAVIKRSPHCSKKSRPANRT
ncbi:hypothetical protein [Gilvimarinus agarilyticus]|uniref:hypothetical protein n=1 Tax=Gilvimarinus agarilyticus TaxID=679259 RepID=UPI0005A260D8|nr:hypothetical protein [Gilvimarinus agarilyticus]